MVDQTDYYGAKIPNVIFNSIRELFYRCKVVDELFFSNESEFIRESIRVKIQSCYLKVDDFILEADYDDWYKSSIKIRKSLTDQIERVILKHKQYKTRAQFIRIAIIQHVKFWENVCDKMN